jgi:hypothetical protein
MSPLQSLHQVKHAAEKGSLDTAPSSITTSGREQSSLNYRNQAMSTSKDGGESNGMDKRTD